MTYIILLMEHPLKSSPRAKIEPSFGTSLTNLSRRSPVTGSSHIRSNFNETFSKGYERFLGTRREAGSLPRARRVPKHFNRAAVRHPAACNPNPTDHHRRATAQTISLLRCANPDMVSRGRNPGGWQTNYSSPALDQCLLPHRAIRLPRR